MPTTDQKIRTPKEARDEFDEKGISISSWAMSNGFPPNLVYEVLAGNRKAKRGMTHKIAVALGLKAGVIVTDVANAINPRRTRRTEKLAA